MVVVYCLVAVSPIRRAGWVPLGEVDEPCDDRWVGAAVTSLRNLKVPPDQRIRVIWFSISVAVAQRLRLVSWKILEGLVAPRSVVPVRRPDEGDSSGLGVVDASEFFARFLGASFDVALEVRWLRFRTVALPQIIELVRR